MRLVKLAAAPAIAALALTGCAATGDGAAAPNAPAQATVQPVDDDSGSFDGAAAESVLLGSADLPAYLQIPPAQIELALAQAAQLGAPSGAGDVAITPPECSEALAAGQLRMQQALTVLEESAIAGFVQGSGPADASGVVEVLAPTASLGSLPELLDVPDACSSVTLSSGDHQAALSFEQIPIGVGSQSDGLRVSISAQAAGQQVDAVVSVALVQEPTGSLLVAVLGQDDLAAITQQAYDKAESVLQ